MTAIANVQSTTLFFGFEQGMRQQLETLEAENREELRDRESEMREVRVNKARDSRIVEELRPLCEELPDCALDPVSYEPMKTPLVMRCSHSLSSETAGNLARTKGLKKYDKIPCPLCRTETVGAFFVYEQSFDEIIQHLEKVKNVFKKAVENNEETTTNTTTSISKKAKSPRKRKRSIR